MTSCRLPGQYSAVTSNFHSKSLSVNTSYTVNRRMRRVVWPGPWGIEIILIIGFTEISTLVAAISDKELESGPEDVQALET